MLLRRLYPSLPPRSGADLLPEQAAGWCKLIASAADLAALQVQPPAARLHACQLTAFSLPDPAAPLPGSRYALKSHICWGPLGAPAAKRHEPFDRLHGIDVV